jgi:periplasmic copper chaperone A
MARQSKPGRLTVATPRLAGIVLSLVILIGILVVLALFLDNDNDTADEAATVTDAVVASDAWVRVVPAAMPEGGATEMEAGEAAAGEEGDPSGLNAGAFMTLRNTTDEDRRLVGVTVPADIARVAEVHETTVDENDVMRMRPLDWIEIPANGEVTLAPGGLHLMLIDVQPAVGAGDTVELTLVFDDDTVSVVSAAVREAE